MDKRIAKNVRHRVGKSHTKRYAIRVEGRFDTNTPYSYKIEKEVVIDGGVGDTIHKLEGIVETLKLIESTSRDGGHCDTLLTKITKD